MKVNEDPLEYRMTIFDLHLEALLHEVFANRKGGASANSLIDLKIILSGITRGYLARLQKST